MATATKALALDETLQDVVTELQRITGVTTTEELNDLIDVDIATPSNGDALVFNSVAGKWENGAVDVASKANKTDISSIIATGATNTTGSTIPDGATFYLNGTLCRALTDIAANASFTLNTNYETVTLSTKPTLITTGLSPREQTPGVYNCSIEGGGYYIKDGVCFVNLITKSLISSSNDGRIWVMGLPMPAVYPVAMAVFTTRYGGYQCSGEVNTNGVDSWIALNWSNIQSGNTVAFSGSYIVA